MVCSCIKNISRTFLYTSLILFTICSLVIILDPRSVGVKYLVVGHSIKNIFYPTTFEEFKPTLKYYSQVKLMIWNNHTITNIIEDAFAFEYDYWCKYEYIDEYGNTGVNIDRVINNWKTWEYYYLEHDKNFMTEEHKKAMVLRKEWMNNYRDVEIEQHRRYQIH